MKVPLFRKGCFGRSFLVGGLKVEGIVVFFFGGDVPKKIFGAVWEYQTLI